MSTWIAPLRELLAAGVPVVRMAVANVRGSAPREAGATLLFWRDGEGHTRIHGTIGGGHLEARAMQIADHLLASTEQTRHAERFVLGASLGQCCGGVVELFWERFDQLAYAPNVPVAGETCLRFLAVEGTAPAWFGRADAVPLSLPRADFVGQAALLRVGEQRYFVERLTDNTTPVFLYGAGHVGRALVPVLRDLPFAITWVDSREALLDEAMLSLTPQRRAEVTACCDEAPDSLASNVPANAWHIVMTHNHDLDLQICTAVLKSPAFAYLGMLGSASKAKRFRQRLTQQGFDAATITRLVCPIGSSASRSKLPQAIAIAVAAAMLEAREAMAVTTDLLQPARFGGTSI